MAYSSMWPTFESVDSNTFKLILKNDCIVNYVQISANLKNNCVIYTDI